MKYAVIQIDILRIKTVKQIESIMGKDKLKIDFVNGHIQKNLDNFYLNNDKFKISKDLNNGEIGCFASHYLIWKYVYENDLKEVLVLEDDASLEVNFLNKLLDIKHYIPRDYDIFFAFIHPDMKSKFNHEKHYMENEFVCKTFQDWSTLCYLISNKGAKTLLDLVHKNEIVRPVDNFILENADSGNIKSYSPTINNALPVKIYSGYKSRVQKNHV